MCARRKPRGKMAPVLALTLIGSICARGQDPIAPRRGLAPRPVPRVQVLPQPHDEASFQLDGKELTRYHFAPELRRPFLYPVVGPSGRSLTRMGHPHDPESHSHHNSVWISHNAVDGLTFWADRGQRAGRIVQRRPLRYEDGDDEAAAWVENDWIGPEGRIVLRERRRIAVCPLRTGDWLLVLDTRLEPAESDVTLGKTPFGMVGVRMAKTIGVHDGGGRILNSEGGVNEEEIFWKPARWVDYSGPITTESMGGITLLDHPGNPGHPSVFHVRNDGWMGASLTFGGDREIERGSSLRLRYGLWVHGGVPDGEAIDARWSAFAALELTDLGEASER